MLKDAKLSLKKKKRNNDLKNKQLLTAFDRMEYFIVEKRTNEELFKICDAILGGKPVLANLDRLTSAQDCNYMLSFISGVVYATEELRQRFVGFTDNEVITLALATMMGRKTL